jgi:hypothetical protein
MICTEEHSERGLPYLLLHLSRGYRMTPSWIRVCKPPLPYECLG